MNEQQLEQHLSLIETHWTMLRNAHASSASLAAEARQVLMQRYCGAVFRYLLRSVREVSVAEDLTQEFALRFIQGKFGQANPESGKFRNYVKGALFRLVKDHYRNVGSDRLVSNYEEHSHLAAQEADESDDQAFRDSWRSELLSKAWRALEDAEQTSTQPLYSVLRLRADHPELTSEQIAEALGEKRNRAFTAANVRQLLHRARDRFAELLLEEIRRTMPEEPMDHVIEELAELNLLKYCKEILDNR
jgi:RNA polymerase sigma-70 factor (ECF subfamily)